MRILAEETRKMRMVVAWTRKMRIKAREGKWQNKLILL